MTPAMQDAMKMYAVYMSQYANDAVCNLCKNIEKPLYAAGYKSKQPFKIYGALMKRCNKYFYTMSHNSIDALTLSYLYSEIDEVIDPLVRELQDSLEEYMRSYGIKQARLISMIETTLMLASFSIDITKKFCKNIISFDKRITVLEEIGCHELPSILNSLFRFVVEVERLPEDTDINLNDCERATAAFDKFQETYLDPNLFIEAMNKSNLC